jgi:hypothetical protein
MSSAVANFGIAVGITSVVCYALMTRLQNQRRRRARAGGSGTDGGSEFSGTNDGFSFGSWFSSNSSALDSSGNPIDGGSCSSSSDSSSDSGDCGGGGDGGGGGSD